MTINDTNVIGIDVGLDGALAVNFASGELIVESTPAVVVGGTKTGKRDYMPALMRRLLAAVPDPKVAVIEKVHAMPKQGVVSSFVLGGGLYIWIGLLAGLEIPYTLVDPVRWKKRMLPDMGRDKEVARLRALQLWPHMAEELARKGDHGKAEALLIAAYGRETWDSTDN